MKHLEIINSPVELNLENYAMAGAPIINKERKLGDLAGIFQDEIAFSEMDKEQPAYTIQAWLPVAEGTPGGLFFGVSTIYPGKVSNEYFMTRGHFHLQPERVEFYWCIRGKGSLILMNRERNTWAEKVYPGSLHYIGGETAHRLVNTGNQNLIVGACWSSDAGHN